jgi:hypothetical protein
MLDACLDAQSLSRAPCKAHREMGYGHEQRKHAKHGTIHRFRSQARLVGGSSDAHDTNRLDPASRAGGRTGGGVLGLYLLAGFLGLGVLGLIIGVMAQRIELEKDGAVSNVMTTSLYADQFRAREQMTRAEKAEHRAETRALLKVLFVAKVVSAGLIILGFGFFVLFQLA